MLKQPKKNDTVLCDMQKTRLSEHLVADFALLLCISCQMQQNTQNDSNNTGSAAGQPKTLQQV